MKTTAYKKYARRPFRSTAIHVNGLQGLLPEQTWYRGGETGLADGNWRGCDWLAVTLIGLVVAVEIIAHGQPSSPLSALRYDPYVWGAIAGGALVYATGFRVGWSRGLAGLAVLLPLSAVLGPFGLSATASLTGTPIDPYLAAWDAAIGNPSIVAHALMHSEPWLYAAAAYAYAMLPLWIAVVGVAEIVRGTRGTSVIALSVGAGLVGFALYWMFPAVGPRAWFGGDGWVNMMAWGAPVPALDGAPRNAFPSLHTTWAALCWLAARDVGRWWGYAGGVFLGLTLLATMGSGHHYAVDLLAAVPLVWIVWRMGR